MEFEVFGRMRIRHDGHEVTMAGRLQRVLCGVLLAHANTPVPAEVLSEAMWGGARDERAASRLHLHVHRLRRLLSEPERLRSEPGGYRLVVYPGELDAERFESLLDEGAAVRATDPRRAAERIRAGLDLWQGRPFEGTDTALLENRAHSLEERRVAGIDELYSAELALGRHSAVLGELVEQVRQNPLHEHLHGLLMVAFHRSGQPGRALAVYHTVRRALVDELGQEPGPELRHIEQCVLTGQAVDAEHTRPGAMPPAQLPHDAHGFTGREGELAFLDGVLDQDPTAPVSVISGSGGVGKTALALRWAHRVRDRFPDGQLYVDLRGFGPQAPMDPEYALAGFLRELGVDGAAIPSGIDARAARFRTLVAGRRILLLLDNARTAEQVRSLLPGSPSVLVLVTSRDALTGLVAREGARRIPLDRLPSAEAVDLLRGLIGARVHQEPRAVAEMVERCARLPLALRVAAELVNASPRHGIGELAAELADEQHALDVLDAGGDPTASVRSVLSWSYQQLSPGSARVFRLLGSFPGYDIDVAAAAALTGEDTATTRAVLRALSRAHLIEEGAGGRYLMHDLLRAHACDLGRAQDTEADRDSAVNGLFEHYLSTVPVATEAAHGRAAPPVGVPLPRAGGATRFSSGTDAAQWLEAERANLVRATEQAARIGDWRTVTGLASALRRHLSLRGHHDEALTVYGIGLDAAYRLGDPAIEATGNRCVGSVYRRLGRLDEAMEYMRRAHDSFQRAGLEREQRLQQIQLGVMCAYLGRFREAYDHLHQVLVSSAGLGEEGRASLVPAHAYLGHLLHLLGKNEAALEHLTEALDLARDDAPGRRIDAEAIIGWVYRALDLPERALHHLEFARSTAQDTGNRFIEAWVHPLAHVYWQLGRREEAFACAEHCVTVAASTNERLISPSAYNTLGELYRLDGSPDEALAHHHNALAEAESGGIQYCNANAHTGIGDVHHDLGDRVRARSHWRRAVDILERIGVPAADDVRARLLTP